MWCNSKLFEKSFAHFEGMCLHYIIIVKGFVYTYMDSDYNDVSQLSKYLLRTLCSELMNMVVFSLAEDSGLTVPNDHNLSSTVSS